MSVDNTPDDNVPAVADANPAQGHSAVTGPASGPDDDRGTQGLRSATTHGRRKFFQQIGVASLGLTAGMVGAPVLAAPTSYLPDASEDLPGEVGRLGIRARREAAFATRLRAARFHFQQPLRKFKNNGDEQRYANKIASYSKALPHDNKGEVDGTAYEALAQALRSGTAEDFAQVPLGGTLKLFNPRDSYAFSLEGRDTQDYRIRPAPAFDSKEKASEMAELYWQALTRDVHFADYDSDPMIQAAAEDLSAFSEFQGPKAGGQVTADTLFRGVTAGDAVGPYLSQFLWLNLPYGAVPVQQRVRTGLAGQNYMTSYTQWLAVQNGTVTEQLQLDPMPRFIRNGRDLAAYVGRDFPFQPFLSAALILSAMRAPMSEAIPYPTATESAFGVLGPIHLFTLLGSVARLAVLATQWQKWLVHNNLRPETFGGRVQHVAEGSADYPIDPELLNSKGVEKVFALQGNYLLSQAYPEGCPTNPSYPAGHAVIAGACATVLKAFFRESWALPQPVQANADGTALMPYQGSELTVGHELDKLASNMAIGRDVAGVHYRSDGIDGQMLGEEVAISVLRDYRFTLTEEFSGFRFTRFNGKAIVV